MVATFNRRTLLLGVGGIVSLPPAVVGDVGPEFVVPLSMDQMIVGVVVRAAVHEAVAEACRRLGVP